MTGQTQTFSTLELLREMLLKDGFRPIRNEAGKSTHHPHVEFAKRVAEIPNQYFQPFAMTHEGRYIDLLVTSPVVLWPVSSIDTVVLRAIERAPFYATIAMRVSPEGYESWHVNNGEVAIKEHLENKLPLYRAKVEEHFAHGRFSRETPIAETNPHLAREEKQAYVDYGWRVRFNLPDTYDLSPKQRAEEMYNVLKTLYNCFNPPGNPVALSRETSLPPVKPLEVYNVHQS